LKLSKARLARMDAWMRANARPYDLAKWDLLFNGGTKDKLVEEMLKYQNSDGGFGNGFEADILLPDSAPMVSAEAVFLAYEYGLDCTADCFCRLLDYFERTVEDIPRFWQDAPPQIEDYPHGPWWGYSVSTTFSPNPCAVIASALIAHGTQSQQLLGTKVAERCFEFLLGTEPCDEHMCYNLQRLIERLQSIASPLVTSEIVSAMHSRLRDIVCYDETKWREYFPQPLDLADSPNSQWYADVEQGIERNLEFWLEDLSENDVWTPNFSWGVDTAQSRQATQNWKGHMAPKRAKILANFGILEL